MHANVLRPSGSLIERYSPGCHRISDVGTSCTHSIIEFADGAPVWNGCYCDSFFLCWSSSGLLKGDAGCHGCADGVALGHASILQDLLEVCLLVDSNEMILPVACDVHAKEMSRSFECLT